MTSLANDEALEMELNMNKFHKNSTLKFRQAKLLLKHGGYLGLEKVDRGLQNTTNPTTSTSENDWNEPLRSSSKEQT